MNNEIYKEGDTLICIAGLTTSDDVGGAGYIEGRVFTVRRVDERSDSDGAIYWPLEKEPNNNGLYGRACKLHVRNQVINNYPIY
jgi:hypothetical protein